MKILQLRVIQTLSAIVIVYFFMIQLIISCSDRKHINPFDPHNTDSENSNNANVIMPLKVGNSWTYNLEFIDGSPTENLTFKIESKENINNQEWFNLSIGADKFCRNDEYGLWGADFDGLGSILDKFLLAKYPANVNDTWVNQDYPATVMSIDTEVVVFDRKYTNCYKYKFDYSSSNEGISLVYYKPGIGRVKAEDYDSDGNNLVRIERLSSYLLK